jgi:thiamine-monophosphate kinase
MGAAPRLALLSFALPLGLPVADFDGVADGITSLASRCNLHVAGGNLTRSTGPLVVDITVVGTVKRRQVLTRAGAKPGDEIYVSGSIGGASAGLEMLRATTKGTTDTKDRSQGCVERYLRPEPRVRLGMLLSRNRAATACMDLSDGLADAVRQVARASNVGAILDADALPIDPGACAWFASHGQDPVDAALSGGDDYELLVAVRGRARSRLAALAGSPGAPLTRVGEFTDDKALIVRRPTGDAALPQGYAHFR